MGRKIKGKKHHGTKDPEKQREAREAKIKTKINNRPSHEDTQEIPKRLKQLMKVRDEVKSGSFNHKIERNRKEKDPDFKHLLDSSKYHTATEPTQKGMNKPLKPVPVFKQNPGEHKRAFYYRIDKTIQSMKTRAKFEEKYKVDVKMDPSGQTKIVDREMDEVEMEIENKRIKKLAKKGIVVRTKEEKRKAKREREKLRKNKKKGVDVADKDFENLQDNIEFGERVDAPPTISLNKFPKASSKAGSKSLLLNKTMKGGSGLAKKKKSMAQKVASERDRLRVVEQYRQLKAQK